MRPSLSEKSLRPDAMLRMEREVEAEQCRRSAQHFIFDSGKLVTKDEHDQRNPVKPFPGLPYQRAFLDCLLVSGRIIPPENARYALEVGHSIEWLMALFRTARFATEKSRQVMATWLVCAYLLWRAKHMDHQLIILQSKKEEDAANMVFCKEPFVARISFMESHLPKHLRSCSFPKAGAFGHLYFPNGSHIWAVPEGGEILRSNTPSVWFSDESAYQPEFGKAYTAALPAITGGGQGILLSSAEPGEYQQLLEAEVAA